MTEAGGYNGTYCYVTGDMFCGQIDGIGKPAGRGILYYWESGECDVGTFNGLLQQSGKGIRYSKERDAAFLLEDGQLSGGIVDLEEALLLTGLAETPAVRSKESLPTFSGLDPARKKSNEAWCSYRRLAGLPVHSSPYGPNPYPPAFAAEGTLMTLAGADGE
mmetsp:Transcript_49441/g.115610  ORF Transcript_49441/g.115610 Transcript_49441/m.115610 type:complete len:162 (-) Transcript_49441:51-536(-)